MAKLKDQNQDSNNVKKSTTFKDLYNQSSFSDPSRRPKVIVSLIVLVLFVIFVGLLFSMYNFGVWYPGFSPLIDKIPVLKNLDRSPENVLPKTIAADNGIHSYTYQVNYAIDVKGSSSGNEAQQFNGSTDFNNSSNIKSNSKFSEKFSSNNSSQKSSLVISGKFLQANKKFFVNFSQFPSILSSGIKTNTWILLGQNDFPFLQKLESQNNFNYNSLTVYTKGNSVVNGTVVTLYTVVVPKSDYSKLGFLSLPFSLVKSVFPKFNISGNNIDLNIWVGLADDRIYQESTKFNVTAQGSSASVYFSSSVTSFNSSVNVVTPTTYTNINGKTVTSKSNTKSSNKTSSKK
jgi:hypothetical protein